MLHHSYWEYIGNHSLPNWTHETVVKKPDLIVQQCVPRMGTSYPGGWDLWCRPKWHFVSPWAKGEESHLVRVGLREIFCSGRHCPRSPRSPTWPWATYRPDTSWTAAHQWSSIRVSGCFLLYCLLRWWNSWLEEAKTQASEGWMWFRPASAIIEDFIIPCDSLSCVFGLPNLRKSCTWWEQRLCPGLYFCCTWAFTTPDDTYGVSVIPNHYVLA